LNLLAQIPDQSLGKIGTRASVYNSRHDRKVNVPCRPFSQQKHLICGPGLFRVPFFNFHSKFTCLLVVFPQDFRPIRNIELRHWQELGLAIITAQSDGIKMVRRPGSLAEQSEDKVPEMPRISEHLRIPHQVQIQDGRKK
jgi:hypothetical protein